MSSENPRNVLEQIKRLREIMPALEAERDRAILRLAVTEIETHLTLATEMVGDAAGPRQRMAEMILPSVPQFLVSAAKSTRQAAPGADFVEGSSLPDPSTSDVHERLLAAGQIAASIREDCKPGMLPALYEQITGSHADVVAILETTKNIGGVGF